MNLNDKVAMILVALLGQMNIRTNVAIPRWHPFAGFGRYAQRDQ